MSAERPKRNPHGERVASGHYLIMGHTVLRNIPRGTGDHWTIDGEGDYLTLGEARVVIMRAERLRCLSIGVEAVDDLVGLDGDGDGASAAADVGAEQAREHPSASAGLQFQAEHIAGVADVPHGR